MTKSKFSSAFFSDWEESESNCEDPSKIDEESDGLSEYMKLLLCSEQTRGVGTRGNGRGGRVSENAALVLVAGVLAKCIPGMESKFGIFKEKNPRIHSPAQIF